MSHLILVIGKHAGPPVPHLSLGEVWVASAPWRSTNIDMRPNLTGTLSGNSKYTLIRRLMLRESGKLYNYGNAMFSYTVLLRYIETLQQNIKKDTHLKLH